MSVINKMLQDLDKRNGRPGGEAKPGDAIRSTKPSSAWAGRRNVVLVLAGLATASAAGAWWTQHRAAGAASVVVAPVPPVTVASKGPPAAAPAASGAAIAPLPPPQATVGVHAGASMPSGKSVPAGSGPAAVAAAEASKAVTVATSLDAPKALKVTASPDASKALEVAGPAAQATSAPAVVRDGPDKVETAARPANVAAPSVKTGSAKTYSAMQLSANLVAEAVRLDQQGHLEEAKASLRRALATNPLDLQARQMLVRLQIDTGRVDEAVPLLVEGRRLHPEQPDFTLTLARVKAETGDSAGAIQLLEEGAAAARDEPQYHALLAALLVRAQRHEKAVQHYLVALRNDPANARWLVGVGVALEGMGNHADAAEAYRRAQGTSKLTAETATFVNERLAQLRMLERASAADPVRSAQAPEQ